MARLGQIIKTLNIGIGTAVDFLNKKGQPIEAEPSIKLTDIQEDLLNKEFSTDKNMKEKSDKLLQHRLDKYKPLTVLAKGYSADNKHHTDKKKTNKKKTAEVLPELNLDQKQSAPVSDLPKPKEKKVQPEKEKKIEKEVVAEKTDEQKTDNENIKPDLNTNAVQLKEIEKKEVNKSKPETAHTPKTEEHSPKEEVEIYKPKSQFVNITAPKVLGTIELPKGTGRYSQKIEYERRLMEENDRVVAERRQKRKEEQKKREEERKTEIRKRETEKQKNAEERRKQRELREQQNSQKANKPVEKRPVPEMLKTNVPTLSGPKILGKLDKIPTHKVSTGDGNGQDKRKDGKKIDSRDKRNDKKTPLGNDKKSTVFRDKDKKNKERKRIGDGRVNINEQSNTSDRFGGKSKPKRQMPVINKDDVNQNVKDTLTILQEGRKFNKGGVKHRQKKRQDVRSEMARIHEIESAESKVLKLTEFATTNDLAKMMKVPVTELISTCMKVGIFVSINQRLEAEIITLLAEEYGFATEFVSAEMSSSVEEEQKDKSEDLLPRSPIVTVMGHVDHGKTSLLDYIRKTNVIAGEAGGITQHIGAYNVTLDSGEHITFLDTPGHEAFTAMRARGAKVTDIAIIIIAADDIAPNNKLMPQTIEAINHATSANVPIVFAINKIDKDGADPEKIKTALSEMNFLVESWGGKYQSQDISAKKGINVNELLEKVLLEAEMLDLKANPNRKAVGSVVEMKKDKGRGNVVTLLVETGTLKQGDIVVAGYAYGKIRAMFNERNQHIKEAKPAEPVLILGMKGELQAGDKFNVMNSEHEARDLINQRDQLKREQKLRTSTHLTLDEIGRRIQMGGFQELNIIVKGDVDGSIEALSDSLIKLSTPEIQVNVIHKAVGQITEGDVNLAITSNAIIIGFQVRPAASARQLAEKESVDIRLYSIIYQAIDEIKAAMEGMLIPEKSEKITATLEVRNTFHISKVGTIAGCIVKDGKIKRNSKIRLIRDGIVIHTGEIASLKHEKDDVREVNTGYECGLNIANNFNDIQERDVIEAFEEIEIKKTL